MRANESTERPLCDSQKEPSIYLDQSTRDSIRNNVAKVASSILIGFRSMIDQLNWMTPFTKKGAYNKIEQLVKNIAYPDFLTYDAQLTAYHATLFCGSQQNPERGRLLHRDFI